MHRRLFFLMATAVPVPVPARFVIVSTATTNYHIFSRLCINHPISDYTAHVLLPRLFSLGFARTSEPLSICISNSLGFVIVVINLHLLMILFIKEHGIFDEKIEGFNGRGGVGKIVFVRCYF